MALHAFTANMKDRTSPIVRAHGRLQVATCIGDVAALGVDCGARALILCSHLTQCRVGPAAEVGAEASARLVRQSHAGQQRMMRVHEVKPPPRNRGAAWAFAFIRLSPLSR